MTRRAQTERPGTVGACCLRAWASSALSLVLLGLAAASSGGARAQEPALVHEPAPAPAIDAEQLQGLVTTLEDPAAREQFLAQLRALIASSKATAPAAPAEIEALGHTFAAELGARLSEFSDSIARVALAMVDVPDMWQWLIAQAEQDTRSYWYEVVGKITAVLLLGGLAHYLVRRLTVEARDRVGSSAAAGVFVRLRRLAARTALGSPRRSADFASDLETGCNRRYAALWPIAIAARPGAARRIAERTRRNAAAVDAGVEAEEDAKSRPRNARHAAQLDVLLHRHVISHDQARAGGRFSRDFHLSGSVIGRLIGRYEPNLPKRPKRYSAPAPDTPSAVEARERFEQASRALGPLAPIAIHVCVVDLPASTWGANGRPNKDGIAILRLSLSVLSLHYFRVRSPRAATAASMHPLHSSAPGAAAPP
jgi:hypothetical protein